MLIDISRRCKWDRTSLCEGTRIPLSILALNLNPHPQVFAEAGCRHLILIDRNSAGLENTVRLLNTNPNRVTAHTLDILDDAAVEEFVSGIRRGYGSLDYAPYVHVLDAMAICQL